jgi:hypothetical protein
LFKNRGWGLDAGMKLSAVKAVVKGLKCMILCAMFGCDYCAVLEVFMPSHNTLILLYVISH